MENMTIMLEPAAPKLKDSTSGKKETLSSKKQSDTDFAAVLDNAQDTKTDNADSVSADKPDTARTANEAAGNPAQNKAQKSGAKDTDKVDKKLTPSAAAVKNSDTVSIAAAVPSINALAAALLIMQKNGSMPQMTSQQTEKLTAILSESPAAASLTALLQTVLSENSVVSKQQSANVQTQQLTDLLTQLNGSANKAAETPSANISDILQQMLQQQTKDTAQAKSDVSQNTILPQTMKNNVGQSSAGNINSQNLSALLKQVQQPQNTADIIPQAIPLNAQDSDSLTSQQQNGKNKAVPLTVIDLTAKPEMLLTNDAASFRGDAQQNLQQNFFTDEKIPQGKEKDAAPSEKTGSTLFASTFLNNIKDAQNSQAAQSAPNAAQQNAALQDKYDIAGQIIKNAQLVKSNENSQMTIQLQPEHLGELSLKISVAADGAVNASFHSDNAQVRNLLQANIVQLKQDLQDQGVKVDNINVYSGLGDLMKNNQNGSRFTQKEPKKSSYRISQIVDAAGQMEDMSTAVPAALIQQSLTSDKIDYRI